MSRLPTHKSVSNASSVSRHQSSERNDVSNASSVSRHQSSERNPSTDEKIDRDSREHPESKRVKLLLPKDLDVRMAKICTSQSSLDWSYTPISPMWICQQYLFKEKDSDFVMQHIGKISYFWTDSYSAITRRQAPVFSQDELLAANQFQTDRGAGYNIFLGYMMVGKWDITSLTCVYLINNIKTNLCGHGIGEEMMRRWKPNATDDDDDNDDGSSWILLPHNPTAIGYWMNVEMRTKILSSGIQRCIEELGHDMSSVLDEDEERLGELDIIEAGQEHRRKDAAIYLMNSREWPDMLQILVLYNMYNGEFTYSELGYRGYLPVWGHTNLCQPMINEKIFNRDGTRKDRFIGVYDKTLLMVLDGCQTHTHSWQTIVDKDDQDIIIPCGIGMEHWRNVEAQTGYLSSILEQVLTNMDELNGEYLPRRHSHVNIVAQWKRCMDTWEWSSDLQEFVTESRQCRMYEEFTTRNDQMPNNTIVLPRYSPEQDSCKPPLIMDGDDRILCQLRDASFWVRPKDGGWTEKDEDIIIRASQDVPCLIGMTRGFCTEGGFGFPTTNDPRTHPEMRYTTRYTKPIQTPFKFHTKYGVTLEQVKSLVGVIMKQGYYVYRCYGFTKHTPYVMKQYKDELSEQLHTCGIHVQALVPLILEYLL